MRPFVDEDLLQLVALFQSVFGPRVGGAADALRADLREVFCRNPWRDEDLPSLVYEGEDGRIVGCLGVLPRPMSMDGRPIRVAVSHTFMVEPGRRSTLAAVELLRTFLSGRQDLTIAQSTDVSRRILEGFGGSTSLLYGIGWTRVLRPSHYLVSISRRAGLPAGLAWALRPFCSATDAVASRVLPARFRLSVPRLHGRELDHDTLRDCLAEVSGNRSLRPEYDPRSLGWLLEFVARRRGLGALRTASVLTSSGDVAGCYLYYVNPGGVSEVVQVAARARAAGEVLDHLFWDARRHGSIAVAGQLDPACMQDLSAKYCLFNRGDGSWFLVHSRHPDLLAAVHRGDAFLTRLEGEWWIRF